ncbi:type II toxin-antitoxin system RelE/ParE family toxin [Polaromonas eurypsychrophila]|uniref:Toxin, RelE family protein n=1 Tax=Polaromonas eurypsychrophila TaxID=1614635 RepID=A0A916SIV9_9BURK|nr:type II toxin-antitoxin system RelE/ParE family toxin [Polaromonas eurypsychrophila]GGB03095.1 toxin, RelE family protein [Polaromonas eurypsychrophila]
MNVQTTAVYLEWINALKDQAVRARIQVRVDRLAHGNPGQHRHLSDGVSELKIDLGPGYRVYYTECDGELIVLLAGGDKSSQQRDIRSAIALARNL